MSKFGRHQRGGAGHARDPEAEGRLLYGLHVVEAWLRARPARIRAVIYSSPPAVEVRKIVDLAQAAGVASRIAERDEIERRAEFKRHQGLIAETHPFPYIEIEDVVAVAGRQVLIIDQLQDPHNLGALIRSATAVGASAVITPKDGCVGVTATVEVASAGTAAWMPVCRVTNLVRAIEDLKKAGFWTVGLVPRAPTDLFQFDPPDRVALVVGGETGVRPLVARQFDFTVSIPMSEHVESLNTSVAGALAMYQIGSKLGALGDFVKSCPT